MATVISEITGYDVLTKTKLGSTNIAWLQ